MKASKLTRMVKVALVSFLLFSGATANIGVANAASANAQTEELSAYEELSVSQAVNINTAGAEALSAALKGIGLKKAQAIVAHREKFGAFKTVNELTDIKGIGLATVAKNQSVIVLK